MLPAATDPEQQLFACLILLLQMLWQRRLQPPSAAFLSLDLMLVVSKWLLTGPSVAHLPLMLAAVVALVSSLVLESYY